MCKLIVLDDDLIQLLIIKRMLINYEKFEDTIYSENGNKILDFLNLNKADKSTLPELLFLDLNMPQISGWQFLEKLQVLYPKLVKPIDVYIISSSIDPRDIKRSGKYSFVKSYLIKPVTREALNSIIHNLN